MTELQEFTKRASERTKERRAGRSFETTGTLTLSAEREALLLALPTLTAARSNLQDPETGLFFFMTGYSTPDGGDIYR